MKWYGRVASIKNKSQSDKTEVIRFSTDSYLLLQESSRTEIKRSYQDVSVLKVACLQLSCSYSSEFWKRIGIIALVLHKQ